MSDETLQINISLYKDRPEWKDVTPIFNSEDEDSVIRIAASGEFTDAFAHLRALLNTNEISERALELTKTCVALNAANYSVWQYRRNILKALNKDITEELGFCELATAENPKNYQVWHHRKVLVEMRGDSTGELVFIDSMLMEDPKNYHAWQYRFRQWLVEHFNLYSQHELDYSTRLILEDLRNNSAWNYRYFIVSTLSCAFEDSEMLATEVTFTMHCIRKIPNNESSWSYLSGLLVRDGLNSRDEVRNFCEELLTQPSTSVHLRNFVVDCIAEELEKRGVKADAIEKNVKRAHNLLNELEKLDPVRTKYWRYRRNYINNLVNGF